MGWRTHFLHMAANYRLNSIDLEIISDEIHVYLKLLILLYADDTIIFSNDKENFQKALDNFHEYCNI